MNYHVGIDIGTSSIAVIVTNDEYKIIFQYSTSYNYELSKNGSSEINPEIWFNKVLDAFEKMKDEIEISLIKSINVTGQMHTLVMIDINGKPIRKAMMWNDKRTKSNISSISTKLKENNFLEQSKSVSTGSQLANLLWIKENEYENYLKIHKIMMPKDFIVYSLTGEIQTDYSDASTSSMYDFKEEDWSKGIIELFNLNSSIFPKIQASSTISGTILDEIAKKTGLNNNVAVTTGMGDNPAAMFGLSKTKKIEPFISLGTSGVVLVPKDNYEVEQTIGKKIDFHENDYSKTILSQVSLQTATNANDWLLNIIKIDDYDMIQKAINEKELQKNDIIFIPHLLGEKYIYKNPNLKACFIGMDLTHDSIDLAQATMEGICFALKDICESTNALKSMDCINLVGGGSKSTIWMSLLSTILNVTINVPQIHNIPALGAIKLSINKNIPYSLTSFDPNNMYLDHYNKKYKKYKKVANLLNEEIFTE